MISSKEYLGMHLIWEQIKGKAEMKTITQDEVRSYFRIRKGEVHKYLKGVV